MYTMKTNVTLADLTDASARMYALVQISEFVLADVPGSGTTEILYFCYI